MISCIHQKFKLMSMTFFIVTEIDMEEGKLAISNDLSYNVKLYFPKDIENIFFELLPKTKPIVVGAIYRLPNQTNFMEIFNENVCKADTNNVETYILGDFNINLWQNGHYVMVTLLSHVIQLRLMLKTILICAQCLA